MRIPTMATRALVATLVAGALPLAATASSNASTGSRLSTATSSSCSTPWGSLPKTSSPMVAGPLTGVRAGRHDCFDRLVIDLAGAAPGFSVRYVNAVLTEGRGSVVPLRGGAKLQVVVRAPAYSPNGTASFTPSNRAEVVNVAGYATFRQVAWAGTFEGQTTLGLGVRARLPFRVFTIQDARGSRLVVDVAHHW